MVCTPPWAITTLPTQRTIRWSTAMSTVLSHAPPTTWATRRPSRPSPTLLSITTLHQSTYSSPTPRLWRMPKSEHSLATSPLSTTTSPCPSSTNWSAALATTTTGSSTSKATNSTPMPHTAAQDCLTTRCASVPPTSRVSRSRRSSHSAAYRRTTPTAVPTTRMSVREVPTPSATAS